MARNPKPLTVRELLHQIQARVNHNPAFLDLPVKAWILSQSEAREFFFAGDLDDVPGRAGYAAITIMPNEIVRVTLDGAIDKFTFTEEDEAPYFKIVVIDKTQE